MASCTLPSWHTRRAVESGSACARPRIPYVHGPRQAIGLASRSHRAQQLPSIHPQAGSIPRQTSSATAVPCSAISVTIANDTRNTCQPPYASRWCHWTKAIDCGLLRRRSRYGRRLESGRGRPSSISTTHHVRVGPPRQAAPRILQPRQRASPKGVPDAALH